MENLYGPRCGNTFDISTLIFKIATTTYSNKQNLIVLWRVF